MPSILALALAYNRNKRIEPVMAICLFLVAIFMQSAVNALNDYADFIKGTDTPDNSPDASDAVIVHGLRPATARNLGILFLVLAFIPGMYSVLKCGYVPLVIGIAGALVVVCYSSGRLPISYLPLGELVSGTVMGGLIPLAGYYMQTLVLDWTVLLFAIPVIMGISMIMFSNNGCDIEKDIPAGRHTLACILGRKRTDRLYRILLLVWLCTPVLILMIIHRYMSVLIYLLETPVLLNGFMRQYSLRLSQEQRGQVMGGITGLNIMLGFAYIVVLLFNI